MRNRVIAVGGIQKQHSWFAIVVRLLDDLIEQLARIDCFISMDGNASGFGLFDGAAEAFVFHLFKVRETQRPFLVIFYSLHEGIGDAH